MQGYNGAVNGIDTVLLPSFVMLPSAPASEMAAAPTTEGVPGPVNL